MFRGVYSAATGMDTATRSHEITAHNLAHATTPGYRQRGVVNETFERTLEGALEIDAPRQIGAEVARGYTDFRPGGLQQTGAPFDLALGGNDAFFTLQGPDGPVFSRDGVFQRRADGQLVNTGGLPLLGARGPITLPTNAVNIVVTQDGLVLADGVPVDRLQLARFNNPDRLEPVGTTLFAAPAEAGQQATQAVVLQGYREQSNIQVATAMAALIRDLRYFEASQRAARTISDSVQLVTRPQ